MEGFQLFGFAVRTENGRSCRDQKMKMQLAVNPAG